LDKITDQIGQQQAQKISPLKAEYQKNFQDIVQLQQQEKILETQMTEPLKSAETVLTGIQKDVEAKQSELQVNGETLPPEKLEILNVVRDGVALVLRLQLIQNKFLLDTSPEIMKQFSDVSQQGKTTLDALDQFAKLLKDDTLRKASDTARGAIEDFQKLAGQSQKIATQRRDKIRSLDENGKRVIKEAEDILKEADKTMLATKRTAYTVISIFVLLGIVLSLTISLSLIFSIIRSLNALRASVADLAQGEGDLRKRTKMTPINCSTIMQCGKGDCLSFGKETVCWEESGSYAPVPICIQITSGTLSSCRECKKVYQNIVYNEITEVLTLLNSFMARLQGMFASVTSVVNTLMSAAGSVVSSADMVAKASQNTREKTNTVSESAMKISTNITSVATVMESVSNNARTVAGAAEEMTSTITEIAQNAERTRTTIDKAALQSSIASGQVSKLGNAAKEIDQVTVAIDDISEQVKLLALNATIEAARAGEAGKGFAVVAHEIKELARQASKATEDIRKEIEGIQLLTKGAVDQMETVVAAVHEGKEAVTTIAAAVEEQSATTNELANTISEVALGVNTANEHTLRSSTEAAGIAREISDVHHLSVDIVEHSQQLKNDADILTDVAQKLQGLVKQFKI
ncbi:MAG: hypothetical protein HQK60_02945, partial [Deltaproteobacteria bacterium]|nr:hypothetical protein [Deltaproteobacteria bacterium]